MSGPTTESAPAPQTENTRLHVRIAVLTYKRPEDIAAALPRLTAQAASVTAGSVYADVVVVDNDPEGGAADYVREFAATSDVAVRYENEVTPGISAARNRALDTADGVDLLVFIDDDERPSERWLALMLETYLEHDRPAAVVGSVISEYQVEPDSFIQAGRFFDRRRLPSGTPVDVAATNNLLLDMHQLRAMDLRFDMEFGISGGGDTMFTRTLRKNGGVMIWCDEAEVIDVVPVSRSNRDWVLRKAFRIGSLSSVTSLKLADTTADRVKLRLAQTGRGAVRVAGGAARVLVGVATRSEAHRARGQRTVARGAGMVSGAWGYVYSEYKRS